MTKPRLTLAQWALLVEADRDGSAYTARGDTSAALMKKGLVTRERRLRRGFDVKLTEAGRAFVREYGAEKVQP